MIHAIIPAGGIGKRMQSQKPKQFLTLDGQPVLLITIKALAETGLISRFFVPTIDIVYTKKIIKSNLPDLDIVVCKSGKTRQESVDNALQEIKKSDQDPDFILIHDSVRPLTQRKTIENVIAKARLTGGAVAARPVTDTLKLSYQEGDDHLIKKNVSRDHMWQTQTPQIFKAETIFNAYQKAKEDYFLGTDTAGLVERLGGEVHLVRSLQSNIKITNPEDLELAKMYLKLKDESRVG